MECKAYLSDELSILLAKVIMSTKELISEQIIACDTLGIYLTEYYMSLYFHNAAEEILPKTVFASGEVLHCI